MKRSSQFVLAVLVASSTLAGCGVAARVATDVLSKKSGTSSRSSAPDSSYIASLTPLQSGPGLVVFEPVSASSTSANWGSGLSRWLQVHVAGQGTFGKTPTWGLAEGARREMKAADLRFDSKRAVEAGKLMGVSHVATTQVDGTGDALKWQIEVRDVSTNKAVGSWKLSGSRAQIAAQMPNLARQIALKLGEKVPKIPTKLAFSPDELQFLGALPLRFHFREAIAPVDEARLKTLASRDALGGIMAQRLANLDASGQQIATNLAAQAPDNALVWGEIAYMDAARLMPLQTAFTRASTKFPRNYLLAQAQMRFEEGNRQRPLQVQWAETAVRCAPGNSVAWTDLADAQWQASNAIRRARYSNQISASDWSQINAIYPKAHAAAWQATQVNPRDAHAWGELAQAATFNGDKAAAISALETALELDPGNSSARGWGLEMMQPKWHGSPDDFVKFASDSANHADKFKFPASQVTGTYSRINRRSELKPILETVTAKDPKNVQALMELGAIYHYEDRNYAQAEKLYRQALAIEPDHGRSNSALGDLAYWIHHDPAGAEALYRKAIAADPNDGYFYANLGRMLALTGKKAEGVAAANQAKALGFNDDHPVWAATGVNP